MMVLMAIGDEREDCFHQIKGVDPAHHHQQLINVVWRSFLVVVMCVIDAGDVIGVQVQT